MINIAIFLMRNIVAFILFLIFSNQAIANPFDIKTINKDGRTVFYLHAGAFLQEKKAEDLKKELSLKVKQPIEIKYQKDKKIYLVQIGPIIDYPTTRDIKDKLSEDKSLSLKSDDDNHEENNKAPLSDSRQANPSGKIWNLRSADIRAVIAEVSRVTAKNFIIDPRVQGKISIISNKPINDRELYEVFLSMLQVSGYAAIKSGEVIKIVPNIDAKTIATDQLSKLRSPARSDEMVVEVVPVHYVPAEQLVPVLRPLMPQWSHISAYGPSNMLILSGRAANIRRLSNIIKQVDSSNANGIDIVSLKYALAMDVANTLKDLVKTSSASPMRAQTMLAADDRSNSILLSGSKTERIRLRILISKMDRVGKYGNNSNTQVVYLNYLRAEDLVPILAGIAQANFSGIVGTTIGTITRPALDSTNPASSLANFSRQDSTVTDQTTSTSGSGSATPNTTGAATQTEGSTKPSVQIIAEPNTNSIIINAPASIIAILKSVITQLDIRPAQLLIEALVAEVDEDNVNSLGIEWGSNHQTGDPSHFSPGFAIINSRTNTRDLQAQIYALAEKRKANILSTPSVVVLDNRQAKIMVGKQVSVAATSYPNNAGGTTTASPFTTFERVNVALHLYVRPQITRGQGIQLQIDQGNNELDPSTLAPATQPVFKISSIVTSVHIESGDVVVLGGLVQDSLANNDNRLPILGDIPGLGRLFQHNIRNRTKRVLMVFIKPIILRTDRDALQVTNSKYTDIRQYQLDFLREQEVYHPRDKETVLPPLKQAILPKPFSHKIIAKAMTK